jgi:hypothetical protein
MPLIDNLNHSSKDAFTNGVISAFCTLWWSFDLIEHYRMPGVKQPIIAWLALGTFAIATIYMAARGRELRRTERSSQRSRNAA